MFRKALLIISLFVVSLAAHPQDAGWPRELTNESGKLVLYQPQVDDWKLYQDLTFRMVFSFTGVHHRTAMGVLHLHALTDSDLPNHTVTIYNLTITGVDFPSLPADTAAVLNPLVRSFLAPGKTITMSLDQVVACVPKTKEVSPVAVKNDPPKIFISETPAVLLQVDGKPVFARLETAPLQFVVNANWPLFSDTISGIYYLCAGTVWFRAGALEGPWEHITSLPAVMSAIPIDTTWKSLATVIPPPVIEQSQVPQIFFADGPAELILFDGQATWVKIPGTSLKYSDNTACDLFFDTFGNHYYVLFSGRWFSAASLSGPWVFATPDLPADFAKIPYSSPKAHILVSVPGTEEAKDAVLIAQVPTSVIVNTTVAASQVNVVYFGAADFRPVSGTSMYYAVNTTSKVIQVNDLYYLCYQGIWFVSISGYGPWNVAPAVPQIIYTIPPACPVYNVTYVTQVTLSNGSVQASYSAGYFGAFALGVTAGVVIACGTGYHYPPYFYYPPHAYPIYYPCAATYGYGAYGYHPYAGTSYAAAYNPYTGTYARGATAYGPYGKTSVGQAYNPYTGTYARGASVSTPYGTDKAAQAYNPYTGAYGQTHQESNPYGQWGSTTVNNGHGESATAAHQTTANGTIGAAATSEGGKAVAGSTAYGSGGAAKTASGNMYAAKDGNIYKNTGDGWQQYNNGSFSKPQGSASSYQDLNSEAQNRDRGNFQSQQFQGFQHSGGGSWGGRGGGGGFRR